MLDLRSSLFIFVSYYAIITYIYISLYTRQYLFPQLLIVTQWAPCCFLFMHPFIVGLQRENICHLYKTPRTLKNYPHFLHIIVIKPINVHHYWRRRMKLRKTPPTTTKNFTTSIKFGSNKLNVDGAWCTKSFLFDDTNFIESNIDVLTAPSPRWSDRGGEDPVRVGLN